MKNKHLSNNLYNEPAERAVISAMFVNNNKVDVAGNYVHQNDLYNPIYRRIFHAMLKLRAHNVSVDPITMNDYLNRHHEMQGMNVNDLVNLADNVPASNNFKYYAKIVHRSAMLRKVDRISQQTIKTAQYPQDKSFTDIINNAENSLIDLSLDRERNGIQHTGSITEQVLNHARSLSLNRTGISGIPTGYPDIDKITTGMHNGELIVVAARPAMGKTTFGLNVAQNVASNPRINKSVCIFSLEMSSESLIDRMLCAYGNVNANHLRTGMMTAKEYIRLNQGANHLAKTNILIDDTAGESIDKIIARSRRVAQLTGNLGLIVVDYLQLVSDSHRTDNRQQEVADVSRQLKNLAKTLNVPVLALCQLSRSVEQRENKRPLLSDLRESGAIEQDADIVSFLYRKDYYENKESSVNYDKTDSSNNSKSGDSDYSDTEFIIKKNRSGANGTIHLVFDKPHNKFSSQYHSKKI